MTQTAPTIAAPHARPSRRAGAAILASLLIHVLVFSAIGFHASRLLILSPPETPPIQIFLAPHAVFVPPLQRPAPAKRSAPPAVVRPLPARRPARPATTPPLPPARRAPPAPPRALAPGPPPAPAPAPSGAAQPGPREAEGGGGVKDVLRTSVGCDVEDEDLVNLSPAERGRCHGRVGAEAKKTQPLSGLGRYDNAAEERRRYDRSGSLPNPVRPCSETETHVEGSNFSGGGGCLSGSTVRTPFH